MDRMGDTGADAAAYKEEGNNKFKSGDFRQAAELYAKAIDLDPSNAVLYSNRSNAFLQLSELQSALEDAASAISLKPDWDKGWYRKGCVLEAQGKLDEALQAYHSTLDCSPNNADIWTKVKALKEKQKRTAHMHFEKQQQRKHEQQPQQATLGMPGPAAWANGLTKAQQAEWLVDCCRMRVDDDYCWGGCNLHGLYDPDTSPGMITRDFLQFCKLAVKAGVLPRPWDWALFLNKARGLLPYAFEKSDAKEKWGRENVFAAVTGGTRCATQGRWCMAAAAWNLVLNQQQQRRPVRRWSSSGAAWSRGRAIWPTLMMLGEQRGGGGYVAAWCLSAQ